MAQMFHGVPYGTAAFNDGRLFARDGRRPRRQGDAGRVPGLLPPLRRRPGPAGRRSGRGAGANALTETLFKILDTDKDGKLSKKELMAAERVLHKYDQNDDEIITAAGADADAAALDGMCRRR